MATPTTTEIDRVQEFFTNAPEPTNFCQFVGVLVDDAEIITFKSGSRVVKARIAVQRNGANGADYVNLDDFEEDWYGSSRTSALEGAKKGAGVIVSGEFRKDSSGQGEKRRYFDKIRVRHVVVRSPEEMAQAQRAATAGLI